MIIDHTHPDYVAKWKTLGEDKYNGAYYYSKEIVKNIIPNVKTDRNWITIRLANLKDHPDHRRYAYNLSYVPPPFIKN